MIAEMPKAAPTPAAPKKKKHVGWIVFLVILFVIVVLPVGTLYILFYGSSPAPEVDPTYDFMTDVRNQYVDSLDNTKDTGKISYHIATQSINNLIANKFNEAITDDNPLKQVYDGAYVTVNDDDYSFIINFKTNPEIFKTNAHLKVELNVTEVEGDTNYTFKVKDLSLGRLNVMATPFADLVKQYFPLNLLANVTDSMGLTLSYDQQDFSISISRNTLLDNLKEKMMLDDDRMFLSMVDFFNDSRILQVGHDNENIAKVDINLEPLKESNNHDETKAIDLGQYDLTRKINTLKNEGKIVKADTVNMYEYLLDGYSHVNDTVKSFVSGLDLSSVGIINPSEYEGVRSITGFDLANKIRTESVANLPEIVLTGDVTSITETDLDTYLRESKIMDYVFEFQRDGHYNAITVSNIYTNIYNDKMFFTVELDVNGYKTEVSFESLLGSDTSNPYNLVLNTEHVYYGDKDAGEAFIYQLFQMMENKLGDDLIKADKDTHSISLDLSSVLNDSVKAAIDARGGISYSLVGEEKDSVGEIKLHTNN